MNGNLLIMNLPVDSSDMELLVAMRVMKRSREQSAEGHIVLTIPGFDDDPANVWQNPEVQRFCHRLVELGFISFLDLSTCLPWNAAELHAALGGLEIWLIGEGKFRNSIEITQQLAHRFDDVLATCYSRAAKLVGHPQRR
jgi:hypothetical protein